ncbi:MAG: ABC transporter substrate-binding protein [Acidimicrobiales bacterium]
MNELTPTGSAYDRRRFLQRAVTGAAGVASIGAFGALLEACGSSTPSSKSSGSSGGAGASVGAGGLSALEKKAKSEGSLNVIALPPNWSNYGAIISTFHSKYGITVNSAAPDDSSAQELTAIKALKGQSRAPDVVDVSPSIAAVGVQEKYFTPYKVATWDTIPSNMKDANGMWTGDYYGVISFGCDAAVVKNPPQDWSDLKKPEYKGQVSMNGDPRSAGDAFAAVFGAALANGGSLDDISPGIDFFVELKKNGNWNPTNCLPANIAKGATPIAIEWDYLNIAYNKQFAGNPKLTTVIPKSGKFGNFYCQAISASAPNPQTARLWEEFLFSDQGQLLYLAGYAHPARYLDLASKGLIPASLTAELPPASEYDGIVFPTQAQTTKAAGVLAAKWGPLMA